MVLRYLSIQFQSRIQAFVHLMSKSLNKNWIFHLHRYFTVVSQGHSNLSHSKVINHYKNDFVKQKSKMGACTFYL